jgi:tRNA threonylcarbamoyladenosine biosynthesis protein TsaE
MIVQTKSPKETQRLAGKILDTVRKNKSHIVALEGELGAGKTTLIQAIAKKLGIRNKIKSPTFVLMKRYKYKDGFLYHLDCYRLRDEKDLEPLGFKDILGDSNSLILIEWAERIRKVLPKNRLTIHIDHLGENSRKIEIR